MNDLNLNEKPDVIVADLALNMLGLLNSMVTNGQQHTAETRAILVSASCYFRQVRHGRMVPQQERPGFSSLSADEAVMAMQLTLQQMEQGFEAAKKLQQQAEARADQVKFYADAYLAIREDDECPVSACEERRAFDDVGGDIMMKSFHGEDLDDLMEGYLMERLQRDAGVQESEGV